MYKEISTSDKPNWVEKLLSSYKSNPSIRFLVNLFLVPYGSALDASVVCIFENIREDRYRKFFDQCSKENVIITEEQKQNVDFIYNYYATLKAVNHTRRHEKIRLFVRLFTNYAKGETVKDPDQYEDMLSTLDDLSFREFRVLTILYTFENRNLPIKDGQSEDAWVSIFWDDFEKKVEDEIGIPIDELQGFLNRLNRTGLYQTISEPLWNITALKGITTPNFKRFISALGISETNIKQKK